LEKETEWSDESPLGKLSYRLTTHRHVPSVRRHNPISDPYTNGELFRKEERTRDQSFVIPLTRFTRQLCTIIVSSVFRRSMQLVCLNESHIFISSQICHRIDARAFVITKQVKFEYIEERNKNMPPSAAFSKELKDFFEKPLCVAEKCWHHLREFPF